MGIKNALATTGKSALAFVDKNSPAILTGISVVGVGTTAVLTAVGTVKSMNDIFDKDEEEGSFIDTATKMDYVKLCWPNYIPAAISAAATISCMLGSQHINSRRQAALAAAYEIADNALRDYKQKVVEQIGKNKEKKVQTAVDSEAYDKNPPSHDFLASLADNDLIFRDSMTGQYFKSNIDKVRQAGLKANASMREDRVPLNDFLYDCGANYSDMGSDYYLDYYESGEIFVDDFITYSEKEFNGHTFVVGTIHYTCKNRWSA